LLSGPTPWHARGKAKIKILFISIKVGFSFSWGSEDKATLPPVDPWVALPEGESLPKILENPCSWGSVLPPGYKMVESLRSLDKEAVAGVIVHPSGRLEVRQNVVPFAVRLDKVGNSPVAGHDRFDIADLLVNGETLHPDPVEEYFARGQFQDLPADQRLSLPAFEMFKGGVITSPSQAVRIDGTEDVKTPGYEPILIGRDRTSTRYEPGDRFLFITASTAELRDALDSGIIPADLRVQFASAGVYLSPDDSLTTCRLEQMDGWRIYDVAQDCTYTVFEEGQSLNVRGESNGLDWREASVLVEAGAARNAAQRAGPQKRFSPRTPRPLVGVQQERYCIVNALDLTPADLGEGNGPLTRMAADQALQAQLAQQPGLAGKLMVIPEHEVPV
jgi:hypothetical protein